MSLIGILVALIVIGLCWWVLVTLIGAFKVPDPVATVIKVIFVVVVILWLLSAFLGVGTHLRLM